MSKAYDAIAARLLAMTDDAGNWKPCWHRAAAGMPVNAITKHAYSGVNILSLWATDFHDQRWATYQQWQGAGAQVRRGEKGTGVILFKPWSREGDDGPESGLFARGFTVFNIAQVDGYDEANASPLTNPDEPVAAAEAFAAATGARIMNLTGATPCFIPALDCIHMPPFESFHDATGYYGTLLHELTHWSGGKARLDRRQMSLKADRESYALEELVAELGAAFLCADLGLEAEPRADHAQYLAHWHRALKSEPTAFMHAVGEAAKAARYLHSLQEGQRAAA